MDLLPDFSIHWLFELFSNTTVIWIYNSNLFSFLSWLHLAMTQKLNTNERA